MGYPEQLVEAAIERSGLSDLGSPHVFGVIERWCEDLASPQLDDRGRESLERLLINNLVLRTRILATLDENPGILETPVPPVILITGLPRSGTTLLHQLLSAHPRCRPLLRWELTDPLPPPDTATYETDPRIDAAQRKIDRLRGSFLERTHWVNARDPEECPWGYYDATGLLGRGLVAMMHAWADHILTLDHHDTFAEYRKLIQLLLWRNPVPEGPILVLKSPAAAEHLDAFLDVFPNTSLVFTHRDPVRTITSTAAVLGHTARQFTAGADPLAGDGRTNRRIQGMQAAATGALVDFASRRPELVSHVSYQALMTDPVAVTVDTLRQTGVPDPERASEACRLLLDHQRAGARARPPDDYDDYGYTPDQIRVDPTITNYCETFAVPTETHRITAPLATH